jgi:alpha-beta hydrolase superfamily lysophospholipase
MRHHELTIKTHDGLELYAQNWQPEENPKAILTIVHGVGEHSGRYMNLVDALVPKGFAIWSFDHRGHGRSPGRRGHIGAWSDYRGDLDHVLRFIEDRHPTLPRFLLGHSMGSLVVLDYILRDDRSERLEGVIVSGVPFEPVGVAGPALILVAKVLSRILPRFHLTTEITPEALSRDIDVQEAARTDPLSHSQVTARWGTEAMATVSWVKAHPDRVNLPILIVHGGADPLNTAAGAEAWFKEVAHPDKRLRIYPGSLHEVHNDLDHAELAQDILAWLERFVSGAREPGRP